MHHPTKRLKFCEFVNHNVLEKTTTTISAPHIVCHQSISTSSKITLLLKNMAFSIRINNRQIVVTVTALYHRSSSVIRR